MRFYSCYESRGLRRAVAIAMVKMMFLVVCVVKGSSGQCPPCNCFPTPSVSIPLTQLVGQSPLYSQVAVDSPMVQALDSVCLTLTPTSTPDNVLTQQFNTLTDGNSSQRASIQSTNSTGRFYVIGPTRTYYDTVLGSPCPGAYTIYRCPVTGNCVTDDTKVDVIVTSTRVRETDKCIREGIRIALDVFPGLQFAVLPRTSDSACRGVPPVNVTTVKKKH